MKFLALNLCHCGCIICGAERCCTRMHHTGEEPVIAAAYGLCNVHQDISDDKARGFVMEHVDRFAGGQDGSR